MVSEAQEMSPAFRLGAVPPNSSARCGIYAIFCDANGKYYVGSSKNMGQRSRQHERDLRAGRHRNPKLQMAYRKHGGLAFWCKPIEHCDGSTDQLLDREKHWIAVLDSVDSGMNIAKDPHAPRGRQLSDVERAEISKRRIMWIEENGAGSCYSLIDPSGNTHSGRNIAAFCRKLGLGNSFKNGLGCVAAGRAIQFRGWTAVNGRERKPREGHPVYLIPPPGGSICTRNLKQFCRDNDLDYSQMGSLARGDRKNHLGWTVSGSPRVSRATKFRGVARRLASPSGEIIVFHNTAKFCRDNNLTQSAVNAVIKGNRPHHKNWRAAPCS